jgi:hypothetical protein
MARGRFTWTPEERALLRSAYEKAGSGNIGLAALAASLGRLQSNVSREARRLGLTRKGRPQPKETRAKMSQSTTLRLMMNPPNPKFTTRGYRPSEETRAKMRAAAKRNIERGTHPSQRAWTDEQRAVLSRHMTRRLTSGGNVYSRAKRGRRDDLGTPFFRSAWEANYARFLELLRKQGAITKWEHEPETFWFEKIRRGVRSYTPDFRVTQHNGAVYFVEVKGWMDPKSKTKLKRMAKYHPKVDLRVVGAAEYRELARKLGGVISGWEAA